MSRKKKKNPMLTRMDIRFTVPKRAPEPEEPPKPPPERRALTKDEAIEHLWTAKNCFQLDDKGDIIYDADKKPIPNPNWCDAFVYATLGRDVEMGIGEGRRWVATKGTRVLVTMVSRFGDVGIRDKHLVPASNGYDARVMPEDLTEWNMAP